MCQLVTNGFLTGIIDELKQSRKELIYYLIIRDYTTSEYAQVTKTTDRNVRGTRKTAINKVSRDILKFRLFNEYPCFLSTINRKSMC